MPPVDGRVVPTLFTTSKSTDAVVPDDVNAIAAPSFVADQLGAANVAPSPLITIVIGSIVL